MLLKDFIIESQSRLLPLYGKDEAKAVVLSLCEALIGTASYTHIIEPEYRIPENRNVDLQIAVDRLAAGEPLQYVLGTAEFYGLTFKVSPSVLIPRPETELLCRMLLEETIPSMAVPAPRILDLCTGSGCIAWTLAHHLPDSSVTGVDLSEEALAVASAQGIPGHAPLFRRMDVLSPDPDLPEVDLIVSNPPYVMKSEQSRMRKNVLEHEPYMALFVEDDDPLLFYRAVASIASSCLSPEGAGAVEINEALGPETAETFRAAGFTGVRLVKDFSGKDRFVFFRRNSCS